MKILFLVSRLPYTLDKGDKLRAFHQLKFLSQSYEIILFALTDEPIPQDAQKELGEYCSHVIIHPLSRQKAAFNVASAISSKLPMQVAYFYDAHAQHKIDEIIKEHQPDHIFCQLIRMVEYIKKYAHIPKTLDYMDAFSKGMERRIQAAALYQKPFFKLEYSRLKDYETEAFDFFNNKVIISEQDRYFIQHPQKYSIQVVPNGVDTDFFTPKITEDKFDILFSGNLSYPPNIAAAIYLIKKVMPLVWREFPLTTVLLAGKDPVAAVSGLATKKVKVSGTLPDMRSAYSQARLFIAPLFLGTGLQNKILEAMAMALPCITTPQVNNAIGGKKGEQILLADNPNCFATHIIYLLHHPSEMKALGKQGQLMVRKQYSWDYMTARLEKLLNPDLQEHI